ncbi:MAG: aminopeptidase P family protein [Mesorhizobium sp.]|uniref:M24 family metallopeptidase n=1 Tax=Mesorhizobium sp. TaxID=1871066 RepID=UPI000FE328A3|nr:Xaa-Pro peptidase family protein [Mesorhizobium sp.]RWJ11911.1 MAG: aminopeptidase P family protein [Mesorhizobium sp.]
MSVKQIPIPGTGTIFPRSEYEKRQERVLDAVERAGLDGIMVTARSHLRYLTGYSGQGSYFRPFPLILSPGRAPTFIVREFDEGNVRANSCIDEIVAFTEGYEWRTVCADVLRRHGLGNKRVGMELECWGLSPADVTALQAALPDLKIVDAGKLVVSIAAVKDEIEIKAVREAAAMTDLAVITFQESLREGVTESEVAATIRNRVSAAGGEDVQPENLHMVFGERLRVPHQEPDKYPIGMNQGAFIEVSGTKNDYVAPLCRSAVLGRHPGLEALYEIASDALDAGIAIMKPGATTGAVNAAIRGVIERSTHPHALRSRTGYQIGVYWNERGNISIEPRAEDILDVNMTFHLPIILFDENGYQIGCSESILITEQGAEILSKVPRAIYRA